MNWHNINTFWHHMPIIVQCLIVGVAIIIALCTMICISQTSSSSTNGPGLLFLLLIIFCLPFLFTTMPKTRKKDHDRLTVAAGVFTALVLTWWINIRFLMPVWACIIGGLISLYIVAVGNFLWEE